MRQIVTALVLVLTLLMASGCAGLRRLTGKGEGAEKAKEPATVNEWLSQPRPSAASND